jgi:hypothetical protein
MTARGRNTQRSSIEAKSGEYGGGWGRSTVKGVATKDTASIGLGYVIEDIVDGDGRVIE